MSKKDKGKQENDFFCKFDKILLMKTTIVLLLISVNLAVFAISPSKKENLYKHLVEVNKEWVKYANLVPQENISFENDLERIQKHLFLVIENFKKTKNEFSLEQNQERLNLLNVLEKYAEKKVFPINLYHKERRPYFIDHLGTHCAVGYLMQQSGYEDLARKISASENYEYLRNIKTAGVKEWASEHGFSLDELALIQPGYQVDSEYSTIDGTTNGPVTNIEQSGAGLLFSGSFTELKGLPCLNIGYYQDNQLSCFGNGLDGKINDLVTYYGIYVAGKLPFENENFHLAYFENNQWNRFKIPNAENAEGVVVNTKHNFNSSKLFDLVLFYEIENKSEIWSVDTLMNYKKRAQFNGRVYDVNMDYTSTLVGQFDSVFIFNNNQIVDTLTCNNIISYSSNYVFNNSISGSVSETIKTVEEYNGIYYFGGTCDKYDVNSVCVSKYLNGVMQPIVPGSYMYDMFSLDSIFSVEKIRLQQIEERLFFSGDISAGYMYNGSGFLSYNLINNSLEAENNFNGTVYDFINYNGKNYFAGDFSNYLVRDFGSASLDEKEQTQIETYPNPTKDILNFKGVNSQTSFQITDLLGKIISEGQLESELLDLTFLEEGTYFLKLISGTSTRVKTFVKN